MTTTAITKTKTITQTELCRPVLVLVLVFILFSLQATAQYFNAYIHSGVVTAQIEGDELKGFNHWGYTGGVGALLRFDDEGTWSLSLETNYSNRGVYNNKHTIDNLYNINIDLHYVDIPLTVLFKDPYGGIRIGVGPVYSRLVQQPHDTIAFNPDHFLPDTSDMTFLKNDISLAGELRFSIWENLQLSIRYQHSLFPVKKNWKFTEGDHSWLNDCYNQSVYVRLVWQFGEQEKPTHKKSQIRRNSRNNSRPNVRINRRRR